MEFTVLGPLEATVEGAAVALGGLKARTLLALLVMHRNTVVSTDRLAAALWGDEAPADALGGLRTYVSRLRRALGPDGRLTFVGSGYRLALADDELDAARFEALMVDARRSVAVHDHDEAIAALDAALGLWRGDVLDGLDLVTLDLQAEAARLSELRVSASELRAQALLAAGRPDDAVAGLELLVHRHPEREHLTLLLMDALAVGGRRADALAAYQRLRRHLVDELGVEPSHAVQLAQHRLLTEAPAAPALTGSGGSTGPTGSIGSTGSASNGASEHAVNLPRRMTRFVGRADQVARVGALVRSTPLVTLTGTGGVGKSRLADQVARAVADAFPDDVWWCELAPLARGATIGHAVAAALRVRTRHGLSIEESLIEYLQSRRLVLVLDNCEHVLDDAARLVSQVTARCPGVTVLATSREVLGVEGERVYPVPPLVVEEGIALFVDRMRTARPAARSGEQEDSDSDVVRQLCDRLDGLPLAIELAAARARSLSPAEILARLDDLAVLSGGPRTAQPRQRSVVATIEWSHALLDAAEQTLFARFSVFAGGADLDAVHAICADDASPPARTIELVGALVDKSILVATTTSGRTRYTMLETLRAYARRHLDDERERGRRHTRYYVALAARAAAGVQGADEGLWNERIQPDHGNLRAAFDRAMAEDDLDQALALVAALPEVTQIRVGFEAAGWAARAVERAVERGATDHPLLDAAIGAAARGAWAVGDFDRAVALVRRAGGRPLPRGTARTGYPHDVLADIALYNGDVEAALAHYAGQVELARAAQDPLRLVWSLYYVAVCHAVRRRPSDGLAAAREALSLAATTGNPTARSMACYAMGLVIKKSDPATALGLFDEAAELAAGVGNFWWQGIALAEAAATRAVHGDVAEGARALLAVLEHWDRVGDLTQQWLTLRYVVRLLARHRVDVAALTLHHALLAAGKPSALTAQRAAELADGPEGPLSAAAALDGRRLTVGQAVHRAQQGLQTCLH